MYNPPRYMTKEVVSKVLAEFVSPAAYTVDDAGLPDDVSVLFPGCTLVLIESFESDMHMSFELPSCEPLIDLGSALRWLGDGMSPPTTPGLNTFFSPGASLEKVEYGLRNIFLMVLTHFRETLVGDTGWGERYLASRRR